MTRVLLFGSVLWYDASGTRALLGVIVRDSADLLCSAGLDAAPSTTPAGRSNLMSRWAGVSGIARVFLEKGMGAALPQGRTAAVAAAMCAR